MKKTIPTVFPTVLLLILIAFFCRSVWLRGYTTDEQRMRSRNTPYETSEAFATALRRNDPLAYELADPTLWPKIEEWMQDHKARDCERMHYEDIPTSFYTDQESKLFVSTVRHRCSLENNGGGFNYTVEDIVVTDDLMVINFGRVKEISWSELGNE